jgi:hypothetical protein
VIATVDFDHEPRGRSIEVHDEAEHRDLATKRHAELARA